MYCDMQRSNFPQGTIVEHVAYCSGAKAHAPKHHIDEHCRILQFAAYTFDASMMEILTALMHGACVCIPSEDARLNNVVRAINEMHVTHAILTPSFVGFIAPADVPQLQTLVLAGEAMSQAHVTTWSKINLVNGYGPTEASVAAVANSHVTPETDCKDIGFPVGVHCWVVEPSDHNRLVPVGCIGELLLEGPTLARCYLNNPEKTSDSFVFDPVWSQDEGGVTLGRRFYKTGDLVRYNSKQGSLSYVGRKDTQVKFHGRRIELGEIEYHLNADAKVKHGLVLLPNAGHYKQRLIAVLSLSDTLVDNDGTTLKILDGPAKDSYTAEIREDISSRLPSYMVPSTWLCVEAVPMLSSGKLDRKSVTRWAEDISFDVSLDTASEGTSTSPATETENQLRLIWSHVLNIPVHQVGLDRSFLSLGGDSITAMTCMGQAKRKNIGLTVQEILRSKSLQQLATCAKAVNENINHHQLFEVPFELSPIQQYHFQVRGEGEGHFNQSFFLRLTRKILEKDLRRAIETLVGRHSMLRARFSQSAAHGKWEQRITQEIDTSYRLRVHYLSTREQGRPAVADSQACLNAVHGPLLAVDLLDINGQEQLLSLIGHHLVIDLVSWRVILEDLEEILLDPKAAATAAEGSLPFQTWCRLQNEQCQSLLTEKVLPVEDVPGANFAYWGMEGKANTYGDVACEGFELDVADTSLVLTECHGSLRTEVVDVLLSALLHSFAKTFTDRCVPAVYNEGHGREPFDSTIDITRTVGWFTVLYPVFVAISASDELVETVKRTKDLRRRVPDNGRSYFASRFLSSHGREQFSHHCPMEVSFNYLGQYQQLEREGALLQPFEAMAGEAHVGGNTADFGYHTPRFGLFEISAVITQGKLRFSFTFNRYMKHQHMIRMWISHCQQTLSDAATQLASMRPQATLSDFPLLSLTYDGLKILETKKLPQIGISSIAAIEDVYPCSPVQQGLLLSCIKDAAYYTVHGTYEVRAQDQGSVDAERLADAWEKVVSRHAALRTVFVESLSSEGLYDQVVLKRVTTDVTRLFCEKDSDVLTTLDEQKPMKHDSGRPPHRFLVCRTSTGKVFCRLELSHTIMDGASMSVIFGDLGLAYAGQLPDCRATPFSSFMTYLQNQPQEAGISYWKSYLENVEPCHFPILNDGIAVAKQLRSLRLDFAELSQLQTLCDSNGLTLSNAFHTAWSLTLRCYTGSEDACFGYLTTGRDAPIPGVEAAVGPFINMLACRVNMAGSTPLSQVLYHLQQDYIDSLPYRHTSLAEVQHALRLSGTALFNTCLSYRRLSSSVSSDRLPITFSAHTPIHDPTEYPVSINIEVSDEQAAIDLDYWVDALSEGQAANVASVFVQALRNIIYHSEDTVGHLDYLGDHGKDQIWTWNRAVPEPINDCIHQVIERQAKARPGAEAICAWDGKFSYAQLDQLSTRLATYLMSIGIIPETLVPICFDKSAWAIIAMLAVLKAGGGCVPLDATHPKTAIETRVVDAGAQVVLVSLKRAHIFEDIVPHVIPISPSLLDQLPKVGFGNCTTVQPINPSFVIFTSGSTGQPKGVVLEHRAIVTSANAHGSALGIGPQTRFLQFAAYTFDNSLEEIFTTLMRGGCVCVPSDDDRLNNLVGAINKLNANFMDLTPTVAALLQPSDVPTIKAMAVGGEALTRKVVEIWGKSVPVNNQYGPSECSINSTHNGDAGTTEDVSNIGRSVGSVSWLVDASDHNRLVPVGCVGELLIEGPILARGYLNDAEKTAKSFIENPAWVAHDPNGSGLSPRRRMYKTGDLVRYNSDGSLSYLGRRDTQIKLNGQRIELGELEHHVKFYLQSDAQSAVELVNIGGSAKSSKALAVFFYLPSDSAIPLDNQETSILPMSKALQSTVKALEARISGLLPSYMVPSMYIPVSRMPLVSSGKLDRRTLRTMAESLSEERAATFRLGGEGGRAPSTEMENEMQQIFATVLKVSAKSIGADDSFFRHGGDSITAIRLVTTARLKGIHLTVANIFETPKLSGLARRASSIALPPPSVVRPKLQPFALLGNATSVNDLKEEVASICQIGVDSVQDIYPCTSMQEGLIALSSRQPGAYVAQSTYRLPTDIDIPRFRKSWQEVADTEVVLRTRIVFIKTRGFLQVVVRDPITWNSVGSIAEIDRHLPPHDGGILCRYTIVGEGTHAPHFVWTAHHALYDGWSLPILLSRVEARYKSPQMPTQDSAPSYPRFIEYLSGVNTAESDAFWQSRLAESNSPQFPHLPHPAYQVQATSLLTHTARVSKPLGMELTIPSLVRSAWALVVGIYSNSDDVTFGEILTGRDAPVAGIEDMFGPTLATMPTRVCIDRELTLPEFLVDIQKQFAAALPYQYAGLQHVKRLSGSAGTACNFQNLLAIAHANEEPESGFWDMVSSGTIDTNFFTYPLNISCTVGNGKVAIDAQYDQEIIPTWQVSRLLHQFETILSCFTSTESNEGKIGEMDLLSTQDQATIVKWNKEPIELVDKCIHHIIQVQALLQPDAMAVCSWDATFTFQEVDGLATSLAHHLVNNIGIGSEQEVFVPLCFERSAFTIIAMLAVLKSGAAFVPIDPQHPIARLQEIVSEIGASLVLCSPRHQVLCEAIAAQTLAIDDQTLRQLPVHQEAPPSCATNGAAYVLFTSGTTGKPKGSLGMYLELYVLCCC
jgi:amino acid adenylation domain-containing protein/non-ribosomal peptide synthase protein (TIGR01720 family)